MNQTKLSTETLAYLAGYFDGEGSINLGYRKNQDNYQLRIQVRSGDFDALTFFAATFGGNVNIQKYRYSQSKRQLWKLDFSGTKAQEILTLLRPYMRTKHEIVDAVLGLKILSRGGRRTKVGLTLEEKAMRAEVAAYVSAYNNRTTLIENINQAGAVN